MKRSSDNVLRVALAAVRDCADTMETQAVSLLEALPTVPMDDELRTRALELNAGLKDASSRVTFELALLQAEMDAVMMGAVAAMADVADELEKAAELDEVYERSFVLVIEATAAMLQGLEKAKAATQALAVAGPAAARA